MNLAELLARFSLLLTTCFKKSSLMASELWKNRPLIWLLFDDQKNAFSYMEIFPMEQTHQPK